MTRVGRLELRMPRDRQGRFRTEVFERCRRSEKALVGALAEMYVQRVWTGKVKRSPESCANMSSRHRRSAGSMNHWMRNWRSSPRTGCPPQGQKTGVCVLRDASGRRGRRVTAHPGRKSAALATGTSHSGTLLL